MSKLQLEVGKTYLNRSGKEVQIVGNDDDPSFPFDGNNGHCYTASGGFYMHREDERDLVEEVGAQPAPAEGPLVAALGTYSPDAEAVWHVYSEVIKGSPRAPTLEGLIAARKQVVEAFRNA